MAKENTEKQNNNIIFIGDKPFMNYVSAVIMQFTVNKFKEIAIKARGRFMSRAIDTALVSQKILKKQEIDLEIKDIKIDSEEFEGKEKNKKITVSIIEIAMTRK